MKAIIQRDDFWSDLVNGLFLRPVYRMPKVVPKSEPVSDESTVQNPNDVAGKTTQAPGKARGVYRLISDDEASATPLFIHRDREPGLGRIFPQNDDGTFTFDKPISLFDNDVVRKPIFNNLWVGIDPQVGTQLRKINDRFLWKWDTLYMPLGTSTPFENAPTEFKATCVICFGPATGGLDLDHTVGEVVAELKEDSAVSQSPARVPGAQGK